MGTFSAEELFNRVGDRISTVGDSFSIVDGIQYVGGTLSTVGVAQIRLRI